MACALTSDRVMAEAEAVMSGPFAWGACDCSSAACDVFACLHGVDPLAPWRGAYTGAAGAARLIRSMCGPQALAREMAARSGLVPGEAIGAIGLHGRSLIICIAPGWWAGKAKSGIAIVRAADEAWHIA